MKIVPEASLSDRFFLLSLEMLCLAGFDGYFKKLNPAWEKTLGYKTEELMSQPFIEFVHPDDRVATLEEAGRLAAGAETIVFENRYRCKDGTYKWLSWNATAFVEEETLYAVARDITAYKASEADISKLSQALRSFTYGLKQLHQLSTNPYDSFAELLADHLKVGCEIFQLPTGIISHIEGQTYFLNAVQSEIEDLKAGMSFELQNTYCEAVVKQQETVAYAQVGALAHLKNHPVYQSLKLESYISAPIHVHGKIYGTLNFSATQPRIDGFQPHEHEIIELMAQSIGRFIEAQSNESQRRLTEAALRQSESKFRTLLETASLGIVIIDHDGQITLINAKTEELFGYSRAELIGQALEILIPSRLHEAHNGHRVDYLKNPTPRPMGIGLNLIGRRKDGSEFPVEVSISTIQVEERRLALGFVIDITIRVEAQRALAQRTRELARSNSELEKFAYLVSHDLRAPLRALYAYSQFLQEDNAEQLDADGVEYLEGIAESAQQMDGLITGLLEYSRIGRDDLKHLVTQIDIGRLLESIVKRLQLREKAQVNLPQQTPTVTGLALRYEQIFSNLLDNAVKFRLPDVPASVKVTCVTQSDFWKYTVTDNGIGIEEQYLEKIFGTFQRLHTQEEYEGTGIGLAIVRKAIEELDGQIRGRMERLEKEPPSRLQFRKHCRVSKMSNSAFPILLVEDNRHDVRFVKRAFKMSSIANPLYVVPNGQACLYFLRREGDYHDAQDAIRPGIILMDINMPKMDGIDCLRILKADPELKTIPVVMLTTSKEDADRVQSYQLGCNTFIQKPVDFDNFANAIRALHVYWTLSELP